MEDIKLYHLKAKSSEVTKTQHVANLRLMDIYWNRQDV